MAKRPAPITVRGKRREDAGRHEPPASSSGSRMAKCARRLQRGLIDGGADLVLLPFFDAADRAVELLQSENGDGALADYEVEEQREL